MRRYSKIINSMNIKKLFCLWMLCNVCLFEAAADALPSLFQFRHYNIENGMSSNTVYDILQDAEGYIWIGTDNGLNRFDGIEFTFYQKESTSSPEFLTNTISCLCERGDSLWLGTDCGVYIFERKPERIIPFRPVAADSLSPIRSWVTKIVCDPQGNVWIATRSQGVFRYAANGEQLAHYPMREDDGNIFYLLCDKKGELWASTWARLYRFDKQKNQFTAFPLQDNPDSFYSMAMWEDAVGNLWAGTWTEGIWKINPQTGAVERYMEPHGDKGISHIHAIGEYSSNVLLAGSDNGLALIDRITGCSAVYAYYGEETKALSDRFIYPILKDREGGIWIGTFYNGINYLPPYSGQFEGYSEANGNGLFTGTIISRFCEDEDGKIWIASDDGGLSRFDPVRRRFEDFPGRAAFANDNVHALCIDGDNLWVGTYGKNIRILNRKTGAIKDYRDREPEGTSIYTIFKDRRGQIWTGSMSSVCRYDRPTDSLTRIEQVNAIVIDMKEDAKGYLWIATQGDGLYRYQPEQKEWKAYGKAEGIACQIVNQLYIDRKDRLWAATGEGLCLYQEKEDRFGRQVLRIPNECINAIAESDEHLWLTTAKGLVKYHPEDGRTQVFTRSDGLQNESFLPASVQMSKSGEIYIGSINGFNRFHPHRLKSNIQAPAVVLTGLEIFNKPIATENGGILPAAIGELEELHLPYTDNVITLKYAALSYCTPEKNQYAYMLEGFDKDWNYVGSQHNATYTNLPAGTYTFRVKASNNDKVWNEEGTALRIVIHPPFYLSVPFKAAYVVLFVLVLAASIRYIIRRGEKKHAQAIDELNVRKEKEMHEAKISFFTMIAHEIRTPVSLIIGPLEKVMQSTQNLPSEVRNDLNIIDRNSQRLLYLVNQLLDFRKVEQNEMKMRFAPQNIKELMQAVCERFQPSLEQRGITLTEVYPPEDFRADVDREAVTKVLSNLMTNANKYTRDQVKMEFAAQEHTFTLTVTDNGKGMSPKELQLIFRPFYQAHDNKPGTGIGLSIVKGIVEAHHGRIDVLSEENKGSSFRVTLPVRQEKTDSIETAGEVPEVPEGILQVQPAGLANKKLPVVLIAEDNEDMSSFLADSFGTAYVVITAADGTEALQRLKEQEVSLIISDWMMPNMDGIELCRRVREDRLTSHIPFILLTAKTDNASKIAGMNCGADAYIEKPFSMQYLEACVKNLMDLRSQLQQKFSQMPVVPISTIAGNQADEEFLTRMNQLIENNFDNPDLSVDFLAEKLGISRSGLFAKIKALANVTPNEMIQLVRLKKAALLLQENKYHISEVSYMVGFSNPSYFSKCFQKQFGMTPGKFIASGKTATN